MTTKEKTEIAEKLIIIEDEGINMWYEGTFKEDEYYDFDESNTKIEASIKFIRDQLNIPKPKE